MDTSFILSCESTIDLPYSYCEARGIPVLFYSYQVDGISYEDDMGRDPAALPRFYGFLDEGKLPTTAQLNEFQYESFFDALLQQGDVLHIAFGSGMTASVQNAMLAAETLREKYPEDELYLVVGTDMFLSFREWHEYKYLLDNCTLAVLSRETDDRGEILSFKRSLENEDGARIRLIEHEPLPMSSAEIRAMLPKAGGAELLDDGVYSLIIKNRWYAAKPELQWLREKVRPYLTEKRARHVAGCEEQAVKLARRWGADVYEAAEAGILHDITKKLSDEEQLIMCDKYGIILDAAERRSPRILHARTGAALARELFGIPDGIYSAIRWHTTGKPDMSLMEKIIYLADFTEPTRDFEGVEPLRKLCFEDIDRAMELGLRMSLEEIRSRGEDAYKDTVDAYQWYKKEQGGSATC